MDLRLTRKVLNHDNACNTSMVGCNSTSSIAVCPKDGK